MPGIIVLCVLNVYLLWTIKKNEKKRKKDLEEQSDWLFKTLYNINKGTLLPTEHERPMLSKRAVVFKPTEDPMAEFQGLKDDNI